MAEEQPIQLAPITVYAGREYGDFIYYPSDMGNGVNIEIASLSDHENVLNSNFYAYEDYAKYRQENPEIGLPKIDPPETGKGNGNTIGKVAGQPEPSDKPAEESNPPIEIETAQEGSWSAQADDFLNNNPVVEVGSYVPFVGGVIEGGRAASAIWQGNYIAGAEHLANVVPVGKWAGALFKGGKALFRIVEGKKAAKKTARDGKKSKQRERLKCGQGGRYGDLKKQNGGGRFDRDHIPSNQALLTRAKDLFGDSLSESQKRAITNWGNSISIPREAHKDWSPSFGGRNNKKDANGKTLAQRDARDLAGAAQRDVDVMLEQIDKYDEDGGCKKAYKKAAKPILKMKNADYDKALEKLLRDNL